MEQNEQDLQLLMQIREEIHKEIAKIPINVMQLQEVTKLFVEHFKVFEVISQNAQNQLKTTIKNAAFEMAELASEEFTKKVEDQLQNILTSLDQSVGEARLALESVSKNNTTKLIVLAILLILLSLSIGLGLGVYYYKKISYSFSRKFLESY